MTMLDMIAVLIGFVTVMLVLSLVVTGITQAIQAWLKMRERNLVWGLSLLVDAVHTPQAAPNDAVSPAKKKQNVIDATKVAKKAVTFERQPGEPGLVGRLMSVGTPQVGALAEEELPAILKHAAQAEAGGELEQSLADNKRVLEHYKLARERMSDRFRYQIRILTFILSLGVAALFQVSAPDLLTRLSTDPAYRDQLNRAAESIYEQATEVVQAVPSHEEVADQALTAVAEQFPDHAEDIYQAAGVGFDRDSVVGELETVLMDLDNEEREKIVIAYGDKLDEIYAEQFEQALKQYETGVSAAATIDLRILPYGQAYYADPINLIGLVITAILLSFGAPFWFDTLGVLMKIKKSLENPKGGKAGGGNAGNNVTDGAPPNA